MAMLEWVLCIRCGAAFPYDAEKDGEHQCGTMTDVIAEGYACDGTNCKNAERVKDLKTETKIAWDAYADLARHNGRTNAVIDLAFRYLCGLQLQDHPVSVQREHLRMIEAMRKALRGEDAK